MNKTCETEVTNTSTSIMPTSAHTMCISTVKYQFVHSRKPGYIFSWVVVLTSNLPRVGRKGGGDRGGRGTGGGGEMREGGEGQGEGRGKGG